MRYSDDAIAYFARTPDKATVKLVFCSPQDFAVNVSYNPYRLRVVTKQETENLPVYFTISQNGVMRIVNEASARKCDVFAEMRNKRESFE